MSADMLAWVAFGIVATSTTLWFIAMYQVRIPEDRSDFVSAWLGGALLGLVALFQDASGLAFLLALAAAIAGSFFSVLVAISPQITDESAVSVGDALPAFAAPDEHGGRFDSADLDGHPVLIKFFRGHW
jgi:hypothetical protein